MAMQALAGSEKLPVAGSQDMGDAAAGDQLEVSVILRPRAAAVLSQRLEQLRSGNKSGGHMSREAFAAGHGADPADVAAVSDFAKAHGLTVVAEEPARSTVTLAGSVAQFNAAFGVRLRHYTHASGSFRGRTGPIYLPEALHHIVLAVLGLDNRPQARPHFRRRAESGGVQGFADARAAAPPAGTFTPTELAALYDFPDGNGSGECIAIIELGGGFKHADLKSYFTALGVSPTPSVIAVSVDQGKNAPIGDASSADGEVMLDIEVAGAIAPAAKLAVYFAPNTDAGFIDAVSSAANDAVNRPSVISISWGGPESSWTAQARAAFDQALQAAVAMGVTVCVASGDNGSSDGLASGVDTVDFPAASPHVLACGGTSLQASAGAISAESVWNNGANGGASGGGMSADFSVPAWQSGLTFTTVSGTSSPLTGRGVPDVSGDADPHTGYQVRVDGTDTIVGGTSAVAPLWAGLLARINAIKGSPVGFINAELYANAQALRDISAGNNGDFAAVAGWDACTGLGSPSGKQLLALLASPPAS